VASHDVGTILSSLSGVLDVAVYGVAVPHHSGKAGMASIRITPEFDLAMFQREVMKLPGFARPRFIRLTHNEYETTSTLKVKKSRLAELGFSRYREEQVLYRNGDAYLRMDEKAYGMVLEGEVGL
jgi:hypothetical protein